MCGNGFSLYWLKDQSYNFVIRECLCSVKHGAKESARKLAHVPDTEATTFSRGSPCSVTAGDCSETWQPQTQSLQSVQVSIGIAMYPAAVSLHREFHQLQPLPRCQLSRWTLRRGEKPFMEEGWRRCNPRFFFSEKCKPEGEERHYVRSSCSPCTCLLSLRVHGLLPQCRNMHVTTVNCQEVWVKGTISHWWLRPAVN